jgi:hypothetical protein
MAESQYFKFSNSLLFNSPKLVFNFVSTKKNIDKMHKITVKMHINMYF